MNYAYTLTPSDKGFQQFWETVMQSVATLQNPQRKGFWENCENVARLSTNQGQNYQPYPLQNLPDVGTNPPLKNSLQRGENLSLLEREALQSTTYPYFFFKSWTLVKLLKKKKG